MIRILVAFVVLTLAACDGNGQQPVSAEQSSGAAVKAAPRKADTLLIETASGDDHKFKVEVADDDDERRRGLMFRTELGRNRGMIFDFETERNISMWMKNTYIPLDMLFIRADGTIATIAENTTPQSLESVLSGEPVLAVLELNGGTAARLGIREGDRVYHQILGN